MAKTAGRSTPTAARAITASQQPPKPLDPVKDAAAPVPKNAPIRVRATAVGYYDHARRREGDVFTIANEQAFSVKWMERVDPRTREKLTTAQRSLDIKHDELLGGQVQQQGEAAGTGDTDVFSDS